MKVLITTGGTAGHIFPALATVESLHTMYPTAEVLFVGTPHGLEKKLVSQASIPFVALPMRGFMGKKFISAIQSVFLLSYSLLRALKLIIKYKPDVIVGFGGYASLPSLLAGKLLRKPIVLHEQNSIPGTVTRLFARYATTLCVTFEDTKQYFPHSHVVYTGNPVRSIFHFSQENNKVTSPRNILVMGGSLGAMKINELMCSIAPLLIEKGFQIWHQTGVKQYEEILASYKEQGISSIRVSPFIDNMQEAYEWADFAICRAGASTITELALVGVPAILIPFPHAIHNHQYHNAQSLVKAQASICLEEAMITQSSVLEAVEYISTPSVFYEMKEHIQAFAKDSAGKAVVEQIWNAIQQ